MKLQILAIFAPSFKGNKMNNMLRYIVYILLFLLFTITVGQDYHTVETTDLPPQTSCYQQQQDPCKRTVDFLFTNNLQICHK